MGRPQDHPSGDLRSVDDDMVIASTPELKDLPEYLQMPAPQFNYSVEDYKKIAQTTKTDINKQIQAIPGRIDEATRAIPTQPASTGGDIRRSQPSTQSESAGAAEGATLPETAPQTSDRGSAKLKPSSRSCGQITRKRPAQPTATS